MKKLLSILGTVSLITSGSSNLIACNKPNNDENKKDNKINIPIEPEKPKQEQPPKNSNWKLVVGGFISEKNNDNKNYFGIIKIENGWKTITWIGKRIDWKYQYKAIYRWDGIGEPNTPIIDLKNGKIKNW